MLHNRRAPVNSSAVAKLRGLAGGAATRVLAAPAVWDRTTPCVPMLPLRLHLTAGDP